MCALYYIIRTCMYMHMHVQKVTSQVPVYYRLGYWTLLRPLYLEYDTLWPPHLEYLCNSGRRFSASSLFFRNLLE